MSLPFMLGSVDVAEEQGLAWEPSRAAIDGELRRILGEVVGVAEAVLDHLQPSSGLFGALPELDSMSVANLFTAIEDSFAITVDDEDVDGDMLDTFGGLLAFVEGRLAVR